MIRTPQPKFIIRTPVVIATAALCFACGRSEIGEPVDPNDVRRSEASLSMAEIVASPSLATFRHDNQARMSGSIPALNTQLLQQGASVPGAPQLTEWSRSEYTIAQLDFLPLVHFERRPDGTIVRYMVHFDTGRVMKMKTWSAHDQMWIPIAHMQMEVKTTNRVEPIALWSDLIGAVELPSCRLNERGLYDCAVEREYPAYGYYPRHLAKGEGPSDLVCLADCPNASAPPSDRYYNNAPNPDSQSPFDVYVAYEYAPNEGMLYDGGQEVLPQESDEPDFVSGFLFRMEDKYIAEMACSRGEDIASVHGVCPFNSLPVFYTWTTDGSTPAYGRRPL